MKNPNLGKQGEDIITGFKGVIIGHCDYITGCDQYLLQPKCEKESIVKPDGQWIDEGRLKITGKVIIEPETVTGEDDGCDIPAPIK